MTSSLPPLLPYLNIVRHQLATNLVARDHNTRNVPRMSQRLLCSLLAQARLLPELRTQALQSLDTLLDDLCAELAPIDGSLMLNSLLMRHIRIQPDYVAAEPCLEDAVRLLAGAGRGKELQRRIADITAALQRDLKRGIDEMAQVNQSESDAAEPLDADKTRRLRDYLRSHFPADADLDIAGIMRVIGGGSKMTLIVDLKNVKTLPGSLVLRVDMRVSVVGSTVADEFNLVKLAYEAGMPVPRPYLLEAGREVLGAPFIVVSRIVGHNIGDWIDISEPSREFATGLAQALARLHAIPPERAGKIPGSDLTVVQRVAQELDYYEAIWRTSGEPSIAMQQGIAWLRSHLPLADGRRSITHRDVGCHNMLGHEGKLAALLDWETAAIGNPAFDLMYAKVAIVQMMPWGEFLEEYRKAGGIVPSQTEMDYYRLLTAVYGMHFVYLCRMFANAEYTDLLGNAYAAQYLYMYYQGELHEGVKTVLARDD